MELIGGAAAAAIVIEEDDDEEEEALLAIHTLTVPSSEHVAHITCLLYDGDDDSKVEVGSSFSFANDSDMILDCP